MAMVLAYAFLLNLALFRPVQKVLDRRKEVVRSSSSTAENSKAEMNRKFSEYEGALTKARIEASQAKEKSRAEAQARRAEAMSLAKRDVEKAISDAQALVEKDLVAAKAELEASAPSMARLAASRILGRGRR